MFNFQISEMTNTRSGTLADEQAKVNASNAKIAELTHLKSKVTNAKLKMSKLTMGLSNYGDTQIHLLLDNTWVIALDRKDPNEIDLEALWILLLEEGKNQMPKHQRRMELLKAKKAGNTL